jgi:ABC-type transport system involved in multi-copper enzyme maturation permease subunit
MLSAWWALTWFSFRRHARARLLVVLAAGLLAVSALIVVLITDANGWNMARRRFKQQSYASHLVNLRLVSASLPTTPELTGLTALGGAYETGLYHGTGIYVFSDSIVFALFATFLIPLWTVTFAVDGLGRERDGGTLLWLVTRPLPRSAIFLGTFIALLPWCWLLNVGGFALICALGGVPGHLAWTLYWPATAWGTLTFAALFHAFAATLRRPAVVALLYAFFLETIMGNMPGMFKRLSISFYVRCLMFDRAHDFGVRPERPDIFLPVSGNAAQVALVSVTVGALLVGAWVFSRSERLDAR